jgi:hypothetical protein
MTPDEKKQKFEENIVKLAVQEYYKYVDGKGLKRSEEDCKLFYEVYRMGVFAGVEFATEKYIQSIKNFEESKKNGKD